MRALVIALLFLANVSVASACSRPKPASTNEDDARDKEIIEKAKRADLEMDAIRRSALAVAKGAIVPRPDLGACPIRWKPHLAPRREAARRSLEKYVEPAYEPTDQQLVIDDEVAAKVSGDKHFEPGLLRGRFYVFDHRSREVVCASHVVVTSSSELKVRYQVEYDGRTYEPKKDNLDASAADHLRGDLRQQALLAASESLFVAGPIQDPVDGGAARDAGRDARP